MKLHSQQLRELLAAMDAAEERVANALKDGKVLPHIEVRMAVTLLDPRNVAVDGQYRMFTVVRAVPSEMVKFGWDVEFDAAVSP